MSWAGGSGPDPDLLRGGAERGEFPYLGARLPTLADSGGGTGPVLLSGKPPSPGDVLLEVNGTPVSGLTHRDTLAVIRHFREPVRLKTVRPGQSARAKVRRAGGGGGTLARSSAFSGSRRLERESLRPLLHPGAPAPLQTAPPPTLAFDPCSVSIIKLTFANPFRTPPLFRVFLILVFPPSLSRISSCTEQGFLFYCPFQTRYSFLSRS